jgi:hypothetical protein
MGMASIYDKWRSQIQKGSANLADLQQDLTELVDGVAIEEAELQERRSILEKRKADLQALQGLRNFLVHGSEQTLSTAPAVASSGASLTLSAPGRPRGSKRDAILSILADGQELHTSAIRTTLIGAGEMAPDQKSYHSLQVTLSQMFRAGEIERVARGVYRVAPPSDDEILEHMAYEA